MALMLEYAGKFKSNNEANNNNLFVAIGLFSIELHGNKTQNTQTK
jgi:hypothetical protein